MEVHIILILTQNNHWLNFFIIATFFKGFQKKSFFAFFHDFLKNYRKEIFLRNSLLKSMQNTNFTRLSAIFHFTLPSKLIVDFSEALKTRQFYKKIGKNYVFQRIDWESWNFYHNFLGHVTPDFQKKQNLNNLNGYLFLKLTKNLPTVRLFSNRIELVSWNRMFESWGWYLVRKKVSSIFETTPSAINLCISR